MLLLTGSESYHGLHRVFRRLRRKKRAEASQAEEDVALFGSELNYAAVPDNNGGDVALLGTGRIHPATTNVALLGRGKNSPKTNGSRAFVPGRLGTSRFA